MLEVRIDRAMAATRAHDISPPARSRLADSFVLAFSKRESARNRDFDHAKKN
jgi:hypothetical protein